MCGDNETGGTFSKRKKSADKLNAKHIELTVENE